MNANKFIEIKEERELTQSCYRNFRRLTFLFFYAEWSQDSLELMGILKEYIEGYVMDCVFAFVNSDLEKTQPLCAQLKVQHVPAGLLIDASKNVVKRFEEMDPVVIMEAIEQEVGVFRQNFEVQKSRMYARIEKLLKDHPVICFTKGSVARPECGYTEQLFEALDDLGISYETYNVMNDNENMREWIKDYSGLPTIPQVFMGGKLIGGLDKTREAIKSGEFQKQIPKGSLKGEVDSEFEAILSEARLVLFVTSESEKDKGLAGACQEAIWQLQLKGLIFRHLNLKGRALLEGRLKGLVKTEDCLPYLFLDGKALVGGKLLKEKLQSSDFKELVPEELFRKDVFAEIKQLVYSHNVMLFIKGTPSEPECGFTSQLIEVLAGLKVKYGYFNVYSDEYICDKLPEYSKWKTFPQVFVDGELVGGLDIVRELVAEGEFQEMVRNYLRE
jgi:Grx4 family monothiol glutaredoxin